MTTLLKAHDGKAQAAVQPFRSRTLAPQVSASVPTMTAADLAEPRLPDAIVSDPGPDPRSAQLEREIDELQEQLQNAIVRAEALEADAYQRGLRDGVQQSDHRAAERLDRLSASLGQAQAQLSAALEKCEVLSLEVAQTALERVFGDDTQHGDLCTAAIRHQVSLLERSLIVAVRVPACDFGDPAALAALTAGLPAIEPVPDPALGSGQCIIDLTLGHIEAGIADQWPRLSALLDRLVRDDGAP